MNFRIFSIAALFVTIGSANAALTNIVFDSSFTAADGYMDGALNGQPGVTETQSGFVVSNSAGIGTVTNQNASFNRAQIGGDYLSSLSFVAGDMILIELDDLMIVSDTNNDQILSLGLSTGGTGGAAGLAIGGQLVRSGTDIFVDNRGFPVSGGAVDTGFDVGGGSFDYAIKLTAEAAGSSTTVGYTIDHLINGTSLLTETGQFPATVSTTPQNTGFAGFIQDLDNGDASGANFKFDGFTLSTNVPEPSMVSLLGFGLCSVLLRRRR